MLYFKDQNKKIQILKGEEVKKVINVQEVKNKKQKNREFQKNKRKQLKLFKKIQLCKHLYLSHFNNFSRNKKLKSIKNKLRNICKKP